MADAGRHADASTGHAAPLWTYFVVFVALLGLTAATVGAAYIDLGPLNNVVALGIASVKAVLVLLYFMHVRYSTRMVPLAIVAGVFFVLHLIGGTMGDYLTRGFLGVPGK